MRFGHTLVADLMHITREDEKLERLWWEQYRESFPWASDATMGRLYSQGRYYTWKDGA